MKRSIIFLTVALSACADTEADQQMLSRCWQAVAARQGAVTLVARGVFVPRHGAILVSDSCKARLGVSGDAAYQRLDALSPNRLSTTPIPFAATLVGTLKGMQGPNGELIVQQVDHLSAMGGSEAAALLSKWHSVN